MAKILIVDDSETLRIQLDEILKAAGHETVEAADGILGLGALKNNPDIDMVLCDVNMPNLNGLDMVERVEQPIPVFMLTTEANAEYKARGKAAGVMAWITKPFVGEKLLKGIDKALARSKKS